MKKLLLIAVLLAPAGAVAQVPTGTVSGEIRTREGQPAAGVRVSAMAVPEAGVPANSGTALVSIGTTDNQGRYRLDNVLPGRYYITAGFVDLPTYYPGVPSVSGATVVNVLSGTPVTGINFAVANSVGVTVSGRVRSSTGTSGVGGQPVGMSGGTPPLQPQLTTTAADGSFQFQRVRPGTYQLTSVASPGPVNRLPVVVGDQDITGLEIVVIPTVNVTGEVVVEGNAMPPRLQLLLSPFKGTGQNTNLSMQPDGTFRAMLPEGDYRVTWSNLPVGFEIKSITSGNVDLLSNSLKVAVNNPPSPIRVQLSVDGNPWVKVFGRVTNLGSNRSLTLSGPYMDPIQFTANPDGTFQIPQVLPGTYQARLNNALQAPISLATQLVSVTIPNQDTNNLIIPMPWTKDVPGIVTNAAGAGVQSLLSLRYSQRTSNSSSSGSRTISTQPDGKFTLQVPEGDVQISVTVPGYTVKSFTYGTTDLTRENMKVIPADTAELKVVLDTTSTTIAAGGVVGGVTGGVLGGVLTSAFVSAPLPPPPPLPPPQAPLNRVSTEVAQANLLTSIPPAYPPLARAARVQGNVLLQVEISIQGLVQNITVVSGHPLLNDAAVQAVRQWTYKPFVVNGQTVPVITTVTVNFTLP